MDIPCQQLPWFSQDQRRSLTLSLLPLYVLRASISGERAAAELVVTEALAVVVAAVVLVEVEGSNPLFSHDSIDFLTMISNASVLPLKYCKPVVDIFA